MTVWFTVKLDDRPGSLARVATALGERGVNITGIVGVAEDTDGALMLTTSDAAATREAFAALELAVRGARPDRRPGARGPLGQRPAPRIGRPRLARLMPRPKAAETAAIRFDIVDRAEAISALTTRVAELGGRIRALATVRTVEGDPPLTEIELEVEGLSQEALADGLERLADVRSIHLTRALERSSASGSSWSAGVPRSPRSPWVR